MPQQNQEIHSISRKSSEFYLQLHRQVQKLLTKCIIPAAVNQTDINIETSWAKRIELDVFNTFKYCKISGTVISRNALRKRRPGHTSIETNESGKFSSFIYLKA